MSDNNVFCVLQVNAVNTGGYNILAHANFWRYYGQIWRNMGLIIILGEDNFTSQFYVKRGGDSRKSNVIDCTEDKIAIFGHIMAKFGQI